MVVPFDSSVNVAFPHIVRGFDLGIPEIQWVVIAYTLTYAALTLIFGRIGDMIGYRRVFQTGNLVGVCAFVCCATAPSYGWLLGARVLQGVAAALALSCGPALATSLYPEAHRTRVLGLYTMMFGIGAALGPILAGELVQAFGWRAVFWARAPVALLAFALTWIFPSSPPRPLQRFDAIGAGLLVLAISAFLLTLNLSRDLGHARWSFPAAAALTLCALWAFVRRENGTDQPIINLSYFRDADFALITASHAALNVAGFSIMLLMPFYLDRIAGLSVPLGGLVLASSPAGIVLAGPVAARLSAWISARQIALLGTASMGVAQLAISFASAPAILPPLLLAMGLQGLGLGLFQVACFDISTAAIPRTDRGVAGSLVMMTRTVGVVTGATLLMMTFQTLRGMEAAAGSPEGIAFLSGFQGTFRLAALLPLLVVLTGFARGWGRA